MFLVSNFTFVNSFWIPEMSRGIRSLMKISFVNLFYIKKNYSQ